MYKIIDVYKLYDTSYDGLLMNVIGIYSSYANAEIAKNNNVFTHIVSAKAIKLSDGNIFLLHQDRPIDLDGKLKEAEQKLREEALKKLTPAEQEALGIKS